MTHPKWKTKDEFPGSISLPYGIKTSHTWHEIGQILRIINDLDVYTFIELGAHVGGLASILHWRSRFAPFRYIGYELLDNIIDDDVRINCAVYSKDIFKHKQEIVPRDNDGRIFIYCDNGDKIREMRVFSQYLRSGDLIACHDYYDGQWVDGLEDFGVDNSCGCVPEVWKESLPFLFDDETFVELPAYLLYGTRIMGFMKL